jgi:hypothetical protein
MISEIKEITDENGLPKLEYTFSIDLTPEEIKRAMDFIRNEENTDKELLQYKHLSDEALATIIVDKWQSEIYATFNRLWGKTNN